MVFREKTYSVLLVSAVEAFNNTAMTLLPPTDFWPVTVVHSAGEARRRTVDAQFDIVVINSPLPDDHGVRLACDLCDGSGSAVLLLVRRDNFEEAGARALEHGVVTMAKPAPLSSVEQMLRVMCAMRERIVRMEDRRASVDEKIEEIRLVSRAKWLLIERRGMAEAEAHRYIEKKSMDSRLPRRAVAEQIIKELG
ncbi:MAG TPA: ANTAR domain-containing protein [Firmicutes bacterium]|mgnify:FL=1|nr:ANTAR domain-containing protein [Bacillota bacterium]